MQTAKKLDIRQRLRQLVKMLYQEVQTLKGTDSKLGSETSTERARSIFSSHLYCRKKATIHDFYFNTI